MAKKTPKKNNDVDAYKHKKETRKNAVPVGLASYDTAKPKPKKYEYDPHLDPQLVWTGKAENRFFEVPTVSLHIHERIAPEITMPKTNESTSANQKVIERLHHA
ncbi:MAG: hypothetical protein FJ241_02530 [Nitrospira sp.]|nr:hypothetical protein [Nitrospira sp.]